MNYGMMHSIMCIIRSSKENVIVKESEKDLFGFESCVYDMHHVGVEPTTAAS